jgi:hypothetical protein
VNKLAEQGLTVTCDACNKGFDIEPKCEPVVGSVEKNFFVCPHCNKEYVTYCTDQDIRKKQTELKLLFRELQTARTDKKYLKIVSKIDELQETIKRDMQTLKASFVASG